MPGCIHISSFFLLSRFEQQGELNPSASFNTGYDLSSPFSEGDVFLENSPVSTLQLAYQLAFRQFPVSQQSVRAYLIGKAGKQDRVTLEAAEHPAQLTHVGAEQAVALCAAYLMRQPFAGQELVTVTDVRQVLATAMPALVMLGAEYGTLERRQFVYPQPLSLVESLCRQA